MTGCPYCAPDELCAEHVGTTTPTVVERYHVPRSQVWAGSRGGASGRVHLHVDGRVLCRPSSRPWYPREPMAGELRCRRCVAKAIRDGLDWPADSVTLLDTAG